MAKGQGGVPLPSIGKHLAVLNLFRDADGSVQVTVASAQGAMAEYRAKEPWGDNYKPHLYSDELIVEAVRKLLERRPDLRPNPSDLAIAIGEHAFRAGFKAAAEFVEGCPDEQLNVRAQAALEAAWSAYDPPEELKGQEFL